MPRWDHDDLKNRTMSNNNIHKLLDRVRSALTNERITETNVGTLFEVAEFLLEGIQLREPQGGVCVCTPATEFEPVDRSRCEVHRDIYEAEYRREQERRDKLRQEAYMDVVPKLQNENAELKDKIVALEKSLAKEKILSQGCRRAEIEAIDEKAGVEHKLRDAKAKMESIEKQLCEVEKDRDRLQRIVDSAHIEGPSFGP